MLDRYLDIHSFREEIFVFTGYPIQYLIHNLIVGSGQCQIHGVHVLGECEVARMLTVTGLTENLASCFGFLNIQRSNRNPSYSFDKAFIFTLVLVLRKNINRNGIPSQYSPAIGDII